MIAILMGDGIITACEYYGNASYNSSMLLQNAIAGTLNFPLLFMNVIGWKKELLNKKRGRQIATISDILLAVILAMQGCYGFYLWWNGIYGEVDAAKTFKIAFVAGLFNAGSAWLCPTTRINGKSAQFKLIVDAVICALTIVSSGLALYLGCHWLDPLMTSAVGVGVCLAVGWLLNKNRGRPQIVLASDKWHSRIAG